MVELRSSAVYEGAWKLSLVFRRLKAKLCMEGVLLCMHGIVWKVSYICMEETGSLSVYGTACKPCFFLFSFFMEELGSSAYTNVWGSLEAQLCMEEPGR